MKGSFFQYGLLGIFAIAALIGLYVFATTSGGKNTSTTVGAVTVWGTLPKAGVSQALSTIGNTNQDLRSVTYINKDPGTFVTDLKSAIAEGQGPDLILVSQEDLASLLKVIQPIPASQLPASTFIQNFAEIGGLWYAPDATGAYGVPLLVDPLVLYTNRTTLSSNDIALPPSTWEAITALAPRLTVKSNVGSIVKSIIDLGTYSNVHNARAILSALFLQAGAPLTVISNGVVSADLGENTTPPIGDAVVNFYTQFSDSTKQAYTWNSALPDSQTQFVNGDLALYLGFGSEANYLRSANPNLDFAEAPLPEPATAQAKATYGLAYALAIPNGAKNAAGAAKVITDLTLNTVAEETVAQATGLAPALLQLLAQRPADPNSAVEYASALYAHGWLSPDPLTTDSVFSAMINGVISGRLTPAAAVSSAASALTALLQQQ